MHRSSQIDEKHFNSISSFHRSSNDSFIVRAVKCQKCILSHRYSHHVNFIDFISKIVALYVNSKNENQMHKQYEQKKSIDRRGHQSTLTWHFDYVFIINNIINQINPIDYWHRLIWLKSKKVSTHLSLDNILKNIIKKVNVHHHINVKHFSFCQYRINYFDHRHVTEFDWTLVVGFNCKSIKFINSIDVVQSIAIYRQIEIAFKLWRSNKYIFDRIICDSFSMMQFNQNMNLISEFNEISRLYLLNNEQPLNVLFCDDKKRCRGKRKHRWKSIENQFYQKQQQQQHQDYHHHHQKLHRKNVIIKSNIKLLMLVPMYHNPNCQQIMMHIVSSMVKHEKSAMKRFDWTNNSKRLLSPNVPTSKTIRTNSTQTMALNSLPTKCVQQHSFSKVDGMTPSATKSSQPTSNVFNETKASFLPMADTMSTAPMTITSNRTKLSHINRRITHVSVPNFNHCTNMKCNNVTIPCHKRIGFDCSKIMKMSMYLKKHLYLLLIALMVCGPFISTAAAVHNMKYSTNVVKTKYGQLRGILVRKDPTVEAYLGVPYATPPVGSLR